MHIVNVIGSQELVRVSQVHATWTKPPKNS
jgi:hypothetical protein